MFVRASSPDTAVRALCPLLEGLPLRPTPASGPIKGVNVSSDGSTVNSDEAEWRRKSDAQRMTVVDLANCARTGHIVFLRRVASLANRAEARACRRLARRFRSCCRSPRKI